MLLFLRRHKKGSLWSDYSHAFEGGHCRDTAAPSWRGICKFSIKIKNFRELDRMFQIIESLSRFLKIFTRYFEIIWKGQIQDFLRRSGFSKLCAQAYACSPKGLEKILSVGTVSQVYFHCLRVSFFSQILFAIPTLSLRFKIWTVSACGKILKQVPKVIPFNHRLKIVTTLKCVMKFSLKACQKPQREIHSNLRWRSI